MHVHVMMESVVLQEEKEDTETDNSTRLLLTLTHPPLVLAAQSHREAGEEEERLYGLARTHVKMHAEDAFLRIRVRLHAAMAVMMLALMT
jgi:hypothetical protein